MNELTPEGWPRPKGYANGVVIKGKWVVLAGQIGWNPVSCAFETDNFVEQVRQALENVVTLLREAGATPADLVRLSWFITDRPSYLEGTREIGRVYREIMGSHYPPMSVVIVAGLVEERARVEIEATAVLPD